MLKAETQLQHLIYHDQFSESGSHLTIITVLSLIESDVALSNAIVITKQFLGTL